MLTLIWRRIRWLKKQFNYLTNTSVTRLIGEIALFRQSLKPDWATEKSPSLLLDLLALAVRESQTDFKTVGHSFS